ncbi:3-isopropylmalate dehydrogenase [Polychaeton citri CBS 116435]|uniref:3-isopropylmalate dehydrogenase n=1 Tax=Polychaeton citri CBS 116435 TaxID=1314669 RepID=A0A9P4UN56_9PEZI|nr:3-isopropylmalate dehydrogenase [Polychaeton citri CBS 116435]
MDSSGSIMVLPGDHIGPEIVTEALKVLDIVQDHTGFTFHREFGLCGGCSLDKIGDSVSEEVLQRCTEVDAVFFGSAGGPEWGTRQPNPESGLLRIRQRMQIFANLRPCNFTSKSLIDRSPIKPEIIGGVNFTLVRENCGGAYYGNKQETDDYGCDPWQYRRDEVERVARVAAALALQHSPPSTVFSADKANVLASGRLWRRAITDVFEREFPQVPLQHQLADSLAMLLITQPTRFNGVIVTDNTFGDILSDESGGLTGSLGLLPSASLGGPPAVEVLDDVDNSIPGRNSCGGVRGLYEPVHGSAPDISGKGLANPTAQILSLAMMLRYSFNMQEEAAIIEEAVSRVLGSRADGGLEVRTGDLGGTASTREISEAIQSEVKRLLKGETAR